MYVYIYIYIYIYIYKLSFRLLKYRATLLFLCTTFRVLQNDVWCMIQSAQYKVHDTKS